MDKELNEDARTKQDLLYECSILESRLSNEIIKNENLEQQCKKQKEIIDKIKKEVDKIFVEGQIINKCLLLSIYENIWRILKEVSE